MLIGQSRALVFVATPVTVPGVGSFSINIFLGVYGLRAGFYTADPILEMQSERVTDKPNLHQILPRYWFKTF